MWSSPALDLELSAVFFNSVFMMISCNLLHVYVEPFLIVSYGSSWVSALCGSSQTLSDLSVNINQPMGQINPH